MKPGKDNIDLYAESFKYMQKRQELIAEKLGLEELKSGLNIIRNEKGWRENEKVVDYIWITTVSRSFIGWGGLFTIKFTDNNFREYANPAELIQGIFADKNGTTEIYITSTKEATDKVLDTFSVNLFDANGGIALDGIEFTVRIIARNCNTFICVNNPVTPSWKKWETEIWNMGQGLAKKSNSEEMISLFKDYNL